MEPHLAHRLPWQSLADVIKATRTDRSASYIAIALTEKQLKSIYHFARCWYDALKGFAATDKSSDEEKEELDPRRWDAEEKSHQGWCLGYYDSILWGYLELNLLLTDAKAFEPLLVGDRRSSTESMKSMRGEHYGNHPGSLAAHIQQAFDRFVLRPLTADVRQVLRDHAGMMFRCMYNLLAPRGKIDAEFLVESIKSRFELWRHITWQCETHGHCVSMTASGDACRCEDVKWAEARRFF